MSVSIEINYQRRFAGEDTPLPYKSVISLVIGYTLIVFENGVEKKRIAKSGLQKTGFLSNLETAATFGLGNDAKDELKDIQLLADSIADELSALKK
jgi:hypothetical protein